MKSLKRDKHDSPGKSFTDTSGRLLDTSTTPIQVHLEQSSGDGTSPSHQVVIHLLDRSKRSGQQPVERETLQPPSSSIPVNADQSGCISTTCSMDALCQHMAKFFTAASQQDSGGQQAHADSTEGPAVEQFQMCAGQVMSTQSSPSQAGRKAFETMHNQEIRGQANNLSSPARAESPHRLTEDEIARRKPDIKCQGCVEEAQATIDSNSLYSPDMEITGKFLKLTVAACNELQSPLVSYKRDTTVLHAVAIVGANS